MRLLTAFSLGSALSISAPDNEDKCKVTVDKFACDSCINISKHESQEKIRDQLKKLSPDGFDLFWVRSNGRDQSTRIRCLRALS